MRSLFLSMVLVSVCLADNHDTYRSLWSFAESSAKTKQRVAVVRIDGGQFESFITSPMGYHKIILRADLKATFYPTEEKKTLRIDVVRPKASFRNPWVALAHLAPFRELADKQQKKAVLVALVKGEPAQWVYRGPFSLEEYSVLSVFCKRLKDQSLTAEYGNSATAKLCELVLTKSPKAEQYWALISNKDLSMLDALFCDVELRKTDGKQIPKDLTEILMKEEPALRIAALKHMREAIDFGLSGVDGVVADMEKPLVVELAKLKKVLGTSDERVAYGALLKAIRTSSEKVRKRRNLEEESRCHRQSRSVPAAA